MTKEDIARLELKLTSTASQISKFYFEKYKIDLRKEFNEDNNSIILFGLFFAAKETYIGNTQLTKSKRLTDKHTVQKNELTIVGDTTHLPVYNDQSFSCFLTAVGTLVGATQASNIWASLVAGATAETAVAALKLIAGRVGTIISVGIMIYSVGQCLNWWFSVPFNPEDTTTFGLPPVVRDTTLPLTLDTLSFP